MEQSCYSGNDQIHNEPLPKWIYTNMKSIHIYTFCVPFEKSFVRFIVKRCTKIILFHCSDWCRNNVLSYFRLYGCLQHTWIFYYLAVDQKVFHISCPWARYRYLVRSLRTRCCPSSHTWLQGLFWEVCWHSSNSRVRIIKFVVFEWYSCWIYFHL